jgi:diadenylate cyclase
MGQAAIGHHLAILADLRWQDGADILFLSAVVYWMYVWFWGTKAVKAGIGLLALGLVFLLARSWGLFLTTWVFQILWPVAFVLLIVVFQPEIRQFLERVNPLSLVGSRKRLRSTQWASGVSEAAFGMASGRTGALMVVEREDRVAEWVTGGISLDAESSHELLVAIFQRNSPLHDGAVVIRGGRVASAGCFLPLSSTDGLPKEWGTRHRAAMGLAERCDACVVVASEERGSVCMVRAGRVVDVENPDELARLLSGERDSAQAPDRRNVKGAFRLAAHRWTAKIGALALVGCLWVLLAGKQDVEVTLDVPFEFRNLPEHWEVLEPLSPKAHVTARGLRKDAMSLNAANVYVDLDLTPARLGRRTFRVSRDQIVLPNDRVQVLKIAPSELKFRFREKP